MSRKYYACQCLFKRGRELMSNNFGKVVYVFNSITARNKFVQDMDNSNEYFSIKQKEAFVVTNIKSDTTVGVYPHREWKDVYILADLKQCYGDHYLTLEEFANLA